MKYAVIISAMLFLSACNNTPPQNTTLLLTTPISPLTTEARLYSEAVRESVDALNAKNFQQYADSFAPDSPERDNLRKTFDILTKNNASHQFRGAEVTATSETKVTLRIEQSLIQGSTAELGAYTYELHPVGDAWKIFKYAPETTDTEPKAPITSASASSRPTPVPSASIITSPGLPVNLRAIVEAFTDAVNTRDLSALLATIHPDSALFKEVSQSFELIKQSNLYHQLLSIENSDQRDDSITLKVTRRLSNNSGVTREDVFYHLKKDDDQWKIFKMDIINQVPES